MNSKDWEALGGLVTLLVVAFCIGLFVGISSERVPGVEFNEYCQAFHGMDGAIVDGEYFCGQIEEGHVKKIEVSQMDFEVWRQVRGDK